MFNNLKIFPNRYYQCIIVLIVSILTAFILVSLLDILNVFLYLTCVSILFVIICVSIAFAFSSKESRNLNLKIDSCKNKKKTIGCMVLSLLLFSFGYNLISRAIFPAEQTVMPTPVILHSVLIAPVAEEIVFRGIFLRSIIKANRYSVWSCIIVIALLFAIMHFPSSPHHINWFMYICNVFNAFVLGCMFGLIYMYTGKIVFPVGAHCLANLTTVGLSYMDCSSTKINLFLGIGSVVMGILCFSLICLKNNASIFDNSTNS